jgi:glycosyltransferase involved in cell wall biosynthesis
MSGKIGRWLARSADGEIYVGGSEFADVTVIIPAYNAVWTLAATLQSVLAQTLPPLEIIVVDDASSDQTSLVAGHFAPRVRIIRRPKNGGPGATRNTGIRAARGKWIAFLDADDTWVATKLERQLELDHHPRIGIIACLSDRPRDSAPVEVIFNDLWQKNVLITSSVLLRRKAWEQVGGFHEARALISVEDYNLWVRVAAAGWRILVQQEILVNYNRDGGISSSARRLFGASIFNLEHLETELQIPAATVRSRREAILDQFVRTALHHRDIKMARELAARAARSAPTPARIAYLGATYLPRPILDAKRRLRRALGDDAPPSRRVGAAG